MPGERREMRTGLLDVAVLVPTPVARAAARSNGLLPEEAFAA
jgi:hypothetical protein